MILANPKFVFAVFRSYPSTSLRFALDERVVVCVCCFALHERGVLLCFRSYPSTSLRFALDERVVVCVCCFALDERVVVCVCCFALHERGGDLFCCFVLDESWSGGNWMSGGVICFRSYPSTSLRFALDERGVVCCALLWMSGG